jgi:hypothetical protein
MSPYGPLLAFGALLGAAWLVARTRVGDWFGNRVDQHEPQRLKDPIYALLRREVQVRGRELEGLPYERLIEFDDALAYTSRRVDGIDVYFDAELVKVDRNGDLHVCIDSNARAPDWDWRGVLPSYNFVKRKDGSVYYP